jgi:hypothetical protein
MTEYSILVAQVFDGQPLRVVQDASDEPAQPCHGWNSIDIAVA